MPGADTIEGSRYARNFEWSFMMPKGYHMTLNPNQVTLDPTPGTPGVSFKGHGGSLHPMFHGVS